MEIALTVHLTIDHALGVRNLLLISGAFFHTLPATYQGNPSQVPTLTADDAISLVDFVAGETLIHTAHFSLQIAT